MVNVVSSLWLTESREMIQLFLEMMHLFLNYPSKLPSGHNLIHTETFE